MNETLGDRILGEMAKMKHKTDPDDVQNGVYRLHEDSHYPPDWAKQIDDDEEWQRQMGATEVLVQCRYCGEWTTAISAFCCPKHKQKWIEYQKILEIEREKFKTRKLINPNSCPVCGEVVSGSMQKHLNDCVAVRDIKKLEGK